MNCNNCCCTEKLINFACNPLSPENSEVAAHIAVCPECRDSYEAVLLSIAPQETLPGSITFTDSAAAVKQVMLKNSPWRRFADLVEKLASGIKIFSRNSCGRFNAEPVFGSASTFSAASRLNSPVETITITFESNGEDTLKHYWKMQMRFPDIVTPLSMVQLNMTGSDDRPLTSGELHFLGQVTRVISGKAALSMQKVQAGLGTKDIKFVFPDGYSSCGVIKFLPD